MRDAKSLLLLLVSLLLVLVSFVLIWTWGYRFYNKSDEYKVNAKIVLTDSNSLANRIRDSLQKIYDETLYKLDSQLDSTLINSDSLKAQLEVKLSEFFRLSNEIKAILKDRSSNTNLNVAKQKLGELQNKAEDLKEKNQVVENENQKLGTILEQLNKSGKGTEKNVKPTNTETGLSTEKNNNPIYAVFTASDLKLAAIMTGNDPDAETTVAEKTAKLVGSFTVVNNISQLSNVDMMVIVLQPNGTVLKNSEWDSGSFNTSDGKKIYSYKLSFNYSKGEQKRLIFTLKPERFQKGTYSMQVYHNGIMIGKILKTLS